MMKSACAVLFLSTLAVAQQKPAATPPPAPPAATATAPTTPVPDAGLVAVLKATHQLDGVNAQLLDLSARWKDLQDQFMKNPQVEALQEEGKKLQAQQQSAQAAVDKAKAEAIKSAGLDSSKFDVDVAKGTFVPKAVPAPEVKK